MSNITLTMPSINIENEGSPIAKLTWVDEGVVSLDVVKDTFLDEESINEFGDLLKEGFKELMR